jgi:DUF2075 family protein
MIIYRASKKDFNIDVRDGHIVSKIEKGFEDNGLHDDNPKEVQSWRNSLSFVRNVLDGSAIPDDVEVAIEYRIPMAQSRIDFMILGSTAASPENIVIIELKQWQWVKDTAEAQEHLIWANLLGGSLTQHPSYQAVSYKRSLENYCETITKENVKLIPCAYCHGLDRKAYQKIIENEKYRHWYEEAPIFYSDETVRLRHFIEGFIKARSVDGKLLYNIDTGDIRPQKALQDSLYSMLKGNEEFILLDDQIKAYDLCNSAVAASLADGKKRTVLVEGGPGTGKSVLAINLLVHWVKKGYYAAYITKNAAPRHCYQALLAKHDPDKEINIKKLFPSHMALPYFKENQITVGLFDEAHRLQNKPYMYKGEDMMLDAMKASLVSIFFLDEDQRITTKDIGSRELIAAKSALVHSTLLYGNDYQLRAQFRCNGSDAYIAFINNLLMIRSTGNPVLGPGYDFEVFDDALAMKKALEAKNQSVGLSRMVAGYCFDWNVKNHRGDWDIVLPGGFQAKWNLEGDDIWAVNPDSFDQVGCIHTCQGMEFKYVGVIIGKDLCYEGNRVVTHPQAISKDDHTSGIRSADFLTADRLIRNTYKVLMTRGQKGCYVYCEDPALRDYFRKQLAVKEK